METIPLVSVAKINIKQRGEVDPPKGPPLFCLGRIWRIRLRTGIHDRVLGPVDGSVDVRQNGFKILHGDQQTRRAQGHGHFTVVHVHALVDRVDVDRGVGGHELTTIPVVREGQIGCRISRMERNDHDLVLHVVEGRRDALETNARRQNAHEFDRLADLLLLVDPLRIHALRHLVVVDVRDRKETLDDGTGSQHLVGGDFASVQLLHVQRAEVQDRDHLRQIRINVLTDVAEHVGRTDVHDLAELDGAHHDGRVDTLTGHERGVQSGTVVGVAVVGIVGFHAALVMDMTHELQEHLQVTVVDTDGLNFLAGVQYVFGDRLLHGEVDDDRFALGQFVVGSVGLRTNGHVDLAHVFVAELGVKRVTHGRDLDAVGKGAHGFSHGATVGSACHRSHVRNGESHRSLQVDLGGHEDLQFDDVVAGRVDGGEDRRSSTTAGLGVLVHLHADRELSGTFARVIHLCRHDETRLLRSRHVNDHAFGDLAATFRGVGQVEVHLVEDDTFRDEVGVVVVVVADLRGVECQVKHVDTRTEHHHAVSHELGIRRIGVLVLHRDNGYQLHLYGIGVAVQRHDRETMVVAVAHVAGLVLRLGEVVEFVSVNHVLDDGTGEGVTMDQSAHDTLVGLEQVDSHGQTHVGKNHVHRSTECFTAGTHFAEGDIGQSGSGVHVRVGTAVRVATIVPLSGLNRAGDVTLQRLEHRGGSFSTLACRNVHFFAQFKQRVCYAAADERVLSRRGRHVGFHRTSF